MVYWFSLVWARAVPFYSSGEHTGSQYSRWCAEFFGVWVAWRYQTYSNLRVWKLRRATREVVKIHCSCSQILSPLKGRTSQNPLAGPLIRMGQRICRWRTWTSPGRESPPHGPTIHSTLPSWTAKFLVTTRTSQVKTVTCLHGEG